MVIKIFICITKIILPIDANTAWTSSDRPSAKPSQALKPRYWPRGWGWFLRLMNLPSLLHNKQINKGERERELEGVEERKVRIVYFLLSGKDYIDRLNSVVVYHILSYCISKKKKNIYIYIYTILLYTVYANHIISYHILYYIIKIGLQGPSKF